MALTSGDQVIAVMQRQLAEMRAAGYDRTEVVDSEVTLLNSTSALFRGTFSRQRSDGGEISQLTATYLVTHTPVAVVFQCWRFTASDSFRPAESARLAWVAACS